MSKKKLVEVAAFWEKESSNGVSFYASNSLTFGKLRSILKDFKEKENVGDETRIAFLLFNNTYTQSDNAPMFRMVIKDDEYEKGQ